MSSELEYVVILKNGFNGGIYILFLANDCHDVSIKTGLISPSIAGFMSFLT